MPANDYLNICQSALDAAIFIDVGNIYYYVPHGTVYVAPVDKVNTI